MSSAGMDTISCLENLSVALKDAFLDGVLLMLLEEIYGFLDGHADTSLGCFASVCMAELYVTIPQAAAGQGGHWSGKR